VLTNALYFYATWNQPFDPELTTDGAFTTLAGGSVTVPTMRDTGYLPYAEGANYQLVDLGYDGGALALTIVLPAAGSFGNLRAELNGDWFAQARSSISTEAEVALSLPKFDFTWGSASLRPALIARGMTDAFQYPVADFTGIEPTRELYISDVLHEAFIAIDEDGTEAAAATAVVIAAGSIPDPSPIDFTVDRPFFFFITDTSSNLILFAGQVVDPTA
jgi:serpin B